jgi:hypothetical protein
MRKIVAWIVAIVGLGGSLLTQANWVAGHIGFLSLPSDVRGALIAMSQIPTLFALALLIVGVAGIGFLVHDYGFDRLLLQWAGKATDRGQPPDAAVLNRFAEAERGIAQNKVDLEHLRIDFEQLEARVRSYHDESSHCYHIFKTAIRARDAESKVKEADQIIMSISKKLLNEPYSLIQMNAVGPLIMQYGKRPSDELTA